MTGTKIDHVQGSIKLSRKGLLRRQSTLKWMMSLSTFGNDNDGLWVEEHQQSKDVWFRDENSTKMINDQLSRGPFSLPLLQVWTNDKTLICWRRIITMAPPIMLRSTLLFMSVVSEYLIMLEDTSSNNHHDDGCGELCMANFWLLCFSEYSYSKIVSIIACWRSFKRLVTHVMLSLPSA